MNVLRCISLITILTCTYVPAHAQEDTTTCKLEFRGYIKNMQTLSWVGPQKLSQTDGFLHNRLIFKYKPDSNWTINAEVRNRLFYGEGSRTGGAYYADILDKDNGLWDGAFVGRNNALLWSTMIDRLWIDYARADWRIRVGRQRINWGIATTWTPNDLFNAWNFLDFDYEERPGSDAILIQKRFNETVTIDAAVSGSKPDSSYVAAVRVSSNWKEYDLQWIAGLYKGKYTVGTGWAGPLGQFGFKGEMAWFGADTGSTFSATMQIDRLLPHSWYISTGFLYAGGASGDLLQPSSLAAGTLAPDRLMPVKWSAIVTVVKPVTPILNATVALVYSPRFNLLIAVPALAYNINEDWDIDLTGQIFMLQTPGDRFRDQYLSVFLRLRHSF